MYYYIYYYIYIINTIKHTFIHTIIYIIIYTIIYTIYYTFGGHSRIRQNKQTQTLTLGPNLFHCSKGTGTNTQDTQE